jgi:hypothetical protein
MHSIADEGASVCALPLLAGASADKPRSFGIGAVPFGPAKLRYRQLWRRSAGVLGSAFPVIDLCSRVADRVRKRG